MIETAEDRPNVVVVEDDPNVSLMLRRHMERVGFHVRPALTIDGARHLLKSARWDVLVLDRHLPDGDGIAFCGEVRRMAPHGYIIMLTGDDSDEAKLEGFQRGADDYVTKPFQMQELVARIRAGLRIVGLQKALMESNRRLEELSLTDALTSLHNRRAFEQDLAASYGHARRYDRSLSLMIIDVDHFKRINDTYGHDAGDLVLRAVAQVLDSVTRQSDLAARIGGEEFAMLLPETQLLEAIQVAEKIRAKIAAATISTGDTVHPMTVSIGIASMPHSAVTDRMELFHAADQALYRAKANGRNRIEIERRRSELNRSESRTASASM